MLLTKLLEYDIILMTLLPKGGKMKKIFTFIKDLFGKELKIVIVVGNNNTIQ